MAQRHRRSPITWLRPAGAGAGICLAVAAGCGSPILPDAARADPSPQGFPYCHNHTCETVETLSFDRDEWFGITRALHQNAADAAEERRAVAATVAAFELKAAAKAGTSGDIGGTIAGFLYGGQLDCVDEASNTQTLLIMLRKDRLLRWHRVGAIATRLAILSDGVPHVTATVQDIDTGKLYAIDSWFGDNGTDADVVLLSEWRDGWNPP